MDLNYARGGKSFHRALKALGIVITTTVCDRHICVNYLRHHAVSQNHDALNT